MSKMGRILYVDDESDNLFSFKAVFRRNYQIVTAESGQEALALLEEQSFDLIISDQRMPSMTGVEFLNQVKERYPEPIRMVMTGYSDMQAIIDAINQGNIYYYIAKPWQAEELKVVLDNALEATALRRRTFELERAQIQAQFEVLKNQINPHFLFNSMNTLAFLIDLDQEKAKKFCRSFAQLYRSVLQLRDQQLIDLSEEMRFVDLYLGLQSIRFDDTLSIEKRINPEAMEMGIPPFGLQTVVENVIKHNIVSEDSPMQIHIETQGDQLIVRNILQKRDLGQVESSGTGLSNLLARYELLGAPSPQFGEEGEQFVATLPLFPNG